MEFGPLNVAKWPIEDIETRLICLVRTQVIDLRPDCATGIAKQLLFCVVEDHADGMAVSAANAAHAMAKIDSANTASALNGAMVDSEDHGVALAQRDDLGPRLRARALFGQHEIASREVCSGFRQQDRACSASAQVAWKHTFSGRAGRAAQEGRQYTPVVLTE